jgi:hypothetical protein
MKERILRLLSSWRGLYSYIMNFFSFSSGKSQKSSSIHPFSTISLKLCNLKSFVEIPRCFWNRKMNNSNPTRDFHSLVIMTKMRNRFQ